MPYDFKREFKELYQPTCTPSIVDVPAMHFVAVRGTGNPNEEGGSYQQAVGLLYGISYTIKMSYKGSHEIAGYYPFVVPPLEGLWWQEGSVGVDFTRKQDFCWISMIRLPDFVGQDVFEWAVAEATRKKGTDFSKVEFFEYHEGLCVQCLHVGPFDMEPATVAAMDEFATSEGYVPDFSDTRLHHEIYLSDPRKGNPEKLRTIMRHPVRRSA